MPHYIFVDPVIEIRLELLALACNTVVAGLIDALVVYPLAVNKCSHIELAYLDLIRILEVEYYILILPQADKQCGERSFLVDHLVSINIKCNALGISCSVNNVLVINKQRCQVCVICRKLIRLLCKMIYSIVYDLVDVLC